MSIAYRLFGTLKTLDDVICLMRSRSVDRVEVFATVYDVDDEFREYHCDVSVQGLFTNLLLYEHTPVRCRDLHPTALEKAEIEHTSYREAVEIADKVRDHGFKVTINGEPVYKARELIAQYDKRIEEMRQKLVVHS